MTGSTQLIGASSDDTQSAVTSIGFTFNYNGVDYTQFSANANGLVRLGATVVSTAWSNTAANGGASSPAIMPYWDDLATGTNGKVHYLLTGSAPNQKLVIEWIVTVPRNTTGAANATFQCILNQTTNSIQFVYGPGMVANTTNSGASIGLLSSTSDFNTVTSTTNTNSTGTFVTNNTAAIADGTSYTFSAPTCFAPSGITILAGTTVASISWTTPSIVPSNGYQYEIRTSGAAGSGATGLVQSGTAASGANSVNISSLTNGTTYTAYFRSDCGGTFSGWSSGVNFTTSCKVPTALTIAAGSITSTGADISWTAPAPAPANGYIYEIRTSGAAGSGATGLVSTGSTAAGVTTATLTSLTPGFSYSVYVRSDCGNGDLGNWTSASTFSTTCNTAYTVPYFEGFETGYLHDGLISGCLSQASVTGTYSWRSNNTFTSYNRTPRTGNWNMMLQYGNEDWLFIPVTLTAGTAYTLQFYARQDGATATNASVLASYGTTNTASAMTNVIIPSSTIVNGNYQQFIQSFTPATSGTFYIGIKGTINSTPWFISVDDISVIETPSCQTPTAISGTATGTTTATISWTAPTPAPSTGYEYVVSTTNATPAAAGTSTSGTTASLTGLTFNTTYYVFVRSNCGAGSFSAWSSAATFSTSYCTPAPTSVDAQGITNVTVGTINNTTAAETGNYGDYTAFSTNLTIGAPDTVKITYATGYTYGTKIWIDFNDDLDFNDAGELIYTGLSNNTNPTTLKANFIIPVGAPQGLHRMRIGGTDNDAGPSDACYTGAYGTFEDYTVNIVCPTTILAPTAPVGDIVCATQTADLAITGISGASLSWYNAATAGTLVNSDDTYTTDALAATTSYWVEQSFTGCSAISPRTEVIAIVTPVNLTLTPIDNTCNGYAAGSFALGTVDCGTAPFEYSVNGGAFGAIPTNLAAGTYSIIVRDAALGLSQPISVVVGEPSTVIPTPITANTSVCEDATSKIVTAQPSVFNAGSTVISFDLSAQPAEAIGSANTDTIATAVMPALPAGAVVTSVTLSMPGITALGDSWQADIRLGAAGAILNAAAAGTGAAGGPGLFNFTRTLPNSSVNAAGGTVYLTYWDNVDDNVSAPESTFPIGTGVATITVQYNLPDVNSISWWTAPTGGTQLGTAPTLETVGTSVLPSPAATGTYTFYAQTTKNGCNSITRSPLVVTVLNNPEPVITASNPVLCNGSSIFLISSSATGNVWSTSATATNDSISVNAAGSYTVTVTDANGCVGTSAPYVTTITALPVVSAGTDQTVCANSNVTLVGSGTPTLTWNNGAVNNTPFVATASNTYIVTGTAANGCTNTDTLTLTVNALPTPVITGDLAICAGDSTLLVASSATGNVWSTTATNDSIYVSTAGSYTVTETDANGCIGTSAPVVVVVNALPSVNAGNDIAVCQNSQAILFASGAPTLTWNNNVTNGVSFTATASNTYIVTGTDANGCVDTDTLVLTVNALPIIDGGDNITLCGVGEVTLTATGASVYSWSNGITNGVPFTAEVGSNSYLVTGIDANGCSNTDIVMVTVNNVPVATATAANQLTIVASPAGMSYQWIDCATNTPILGANNQTFTATENGSYKVIVTGMGGCADTSACVNINSVGLENNQADLGISLYPNPTTGNVFVNMPATEEATITVFDAQGKVVMTLENAQNGSVIELSDVQYGMYMIQVANVKGSNIFRIVKN